MEKKIYERVELEILEWKLMDIITTSYIPGFEGEEEGPPSSGGSGGIEF